MEERVCGLRRNGIAITVQHIPDRKRPLLCIEYDDIPELHVVASFNREENAQAFVDAFLKMFYSIEMED